MSGQVKVIVPLEDQTQERHARPGRVGAVGHDQGQAARRLSARRRRQRAAADRDRRRDKTTYGVHEHVAGSGHFTTSYTFGAGEAQIHRRYWFQIATLPSGNYPYAPSSSNRIYVKVGGHPPRATPGSTATIADADGTPCATPAPDAGLNRRWTEDLSG